MNLFIYELQKDLLNNGNCIIRNAYGNSMSPAIYAGALINICPVREKQIKLGDIVFIKTDSDLTLIHRVSRKFKHNGKQFIQTWGDNNPTPDRSVPASYVLGRIFSIKPDNEWQDLKRGTLNYLSYFFKLYGRYYLKRLMIKVRKIFKLDTKKNNCAD
ncbi:MAG: signal peptidase I [Desulfobacteraceae bacterium]|nr:signal peptidase I [Desulfobacteraceae bacterium]